MLNKCTRENVKHVYVQGCLTGVLVGQCWKRVCGEMLTMSGENLENCWSRLRGGMQNSVRGGMISTRHVRECWTPNPYVRKKEDSEQVYEEECSRYNTCIWKMLDTLKSCGEIWGTLNKCIRRNVQHVYVGECSTRVYEECWTPKHVYVGNVGQVYGEECAHVYVGHRKIPSTARTTFSKLCLSYKHVRN